MGIGPQVALEVLVAHPCYSFYYKGIVVCVFTDISIIFENYSLVKLYWLNTGNSILYFHLLYIWRNVLFYKELCLLFQTHWPDT